MKNVNIKSVLVIALLMIAVVILSGCANVENIENCVSDEPYGFWSGLWHGIITPITFFVSLFSDSIDMYAKNNNGGWYDFGYILGICFSFGGGTKATSSRR